MALLSHRNVLCAHCSFTVGSHLWVVMPFMAAGSLHSILSHGLPEQCISVVLRDTLRVLCYLHEQGRIHRDIKAGNILVDSDGLVKLADFGVSASIYETAPAASSSSSSSSAFSGPMIHTSPPSGAALSSSCFNDMPRTPYWMALSSSCLCQEPAKWPSAEELLRHPFFKGCRSRDYDFLVRNVLDAVPTVEERCRDSTQLCGCARGARCVSPCRHASGSDSNIAAAKNRRISGWNFNEESFELDPTDKPPEQQQQPCFPFHHNNDCLRRCLRGHGRQPAGSDTWAGRG